MNMGCQVQGYLLPMFYPFFHLLTQLIMYKFIFSALMLILLVGVGCKTEAPMEPVTEGVEVGAAEFGDLGVSLRLFAPDSLYAGYQSLTAELRDTDTDELRDDLELSVVPLMTMPSMTHSAPIEPSAGPDAEGRYPFQVVFIMAANDMSYWELKVTLRDPQAGQSQTVMVPIEVGSPEEARVRNLVTADDSSKLFLSLVAPTQPEVGLNTFTLAVHGRASMMDYPAVEDLSFEIEPTMPSMGHGSPNNEHPVHTEDGHYVGQVNFTMDGWWQVHVRVLRGDQLIGETDFNITFMVQ